MSKFHKFSENLAKKTTYYAGNTWTFIISLLLIISWLLTGPFFDWSDSHSLFINTVTTIVTFLMVFLLQRTQNKDSTAIQLKLNEIIASIDGSSNRLLNIEDLDEEDIEILRKKYQSLASKTKLDENKTSKHTIEEIED